MLYGQDKSERVGAQNAKSSASCVTVTPKGNLVECTFYVAIEYGAFLFGYGALGVKFVSLPRYHSCGDYKHGVALLRLGGLGCSTCSVTVMKVAVEGRARLAVGACLVLDTTGMRSGNASFMRSG